MPAAPDPQLPVPAQYDSTTGTWTIPIRVSRELFDRMLAGWSPPLEARVELVGGQWELAFRVLSQENV